MAYERRSFAGGAASTTISAGINASTTTIPIVSATGWPDGSAGDFFAVIDRGTSSEEKVRVDTRSGTTLTVLAGGRGADGTAAVSHTAGAAIELCLTAVDLDEANAHIATTALDHHTQYLNNARHDVEARHTFGAALGTPAAAADIGTAAAAGTGTVPSRSDHVHKIGTGAINAAGMFAAGVVDAAAIATDAVGSAEIAALAVGSAELAADAVTTAKILDANVTAAKLAADAVTTAKILDANVTAAKLADLNVTTAKLADDAVTAAKIAVPAIFGSTAGTTSAGGDIAITFGNTFAAAPTVVVSCGDNNNGFFVPHVIHSTVTTTGVTVRCYDATGSAIPSTALRVNWAASGALA